MKKSKKMRVRIGESSHAMVVTSAPDFVPKEEAYREVCFEHPEHGWILGAFSRASMDDLPRAWPTPVECKNGALFVPDLTDASIVAAVKYLFSQSQMLDTFITTDPPDDSPLIITVLPNDTREKVANSVEEAISGNIMGAIVLIKCMGQARTREEILRTLVEYGDSVLDSTPE